MKKVLREFLDDFEGNYIELRPNWGWIEAETTPPKKAKNSTNMVVSS